VRLQAPWTLAVSLAAIAVVTVVLAIPVWRATHGKSDRRLDPIAAARTVIFAKAASMLGALLTGVSAGFLGDQVMRPVIADSQGLLHVLAILGASILLLIAGLVAEQLCVVPPSDGSDDDGPAGAARPE